jgi:hypothetical protein
MCVLWSVNCCNRDSLILVVACLMVKMSGEVACMFDLLLLGSNFVDNVRA